MLASPGAVWLVRCPLVGSHVRPRLPSPGLRPGPQRDQQQRPLRVSPHFHCPFGLPFCPLAACGKAVSQRLTPICLAFQSPEGLVSFQTQGSLCGFCSAKNSYNSTFMMLTPGGTPDVGFSRVGARVWWPSGLRKDGARLLTVSRALSRGRPFTGRSWASWLRLYQVQRDRHLRSVPPRSYPCPLLPSDRPLAEVACAVSPEERRAVSLHLKKSIPGLQLGTGRTLRVTAAGPGAGWGRRAHG